MVGSPRAASPNRGLSPSQAPVEGASSGSPINFNFDSDNNVTGNAQTVSNPTSSSGGLNNNNVINYPSHAKIQDQMDVFVSQGPINPVWHRSSNSDAVSSNIINRASSSSSIGPNILTSSNSAASPPVESANSPATLQIQSTS